MKKIEPSKYGLNKRNKIYKTKNGEVAIVKKRKSRIIMKDGYMLLEIAEKIKTVDPNTEIQLITTAPICSKTKAFLEKNGILTKKVDVI